MAWRLHENVVRGEIDNRLRGRVTGCLWLDGVAECLRLDLKGDCQPDLAGCFLRFENPQPRPLTTPPPALRQNGEAGEITAARKVRVFDLPTEEAYAIMKQGGTPPEHLASAFYLEWSSPLSGQLIIESTDYRLEISEPAWRFSAEELKEMENHRAAAGSAGEIDLPADETQWDEFRSEQFLRESDARTERYGALLKKYADHPDAERIIAREMGWTWLEEALDSAGEGKEEAAPIDPGPVFEEARDFEEPRPDPLREGIDWVRAEDGGVWHPLQAQARAHLSALLDELKATDLFPGCDDDALGEFVGHCMALNGKLAGALGGTARGWDCDPG